MFIRQILLAEIWHGGKFQGILYKKLDVLPPRFYGKDGVRMEKNDPRMVVKSEQK